VPVDQSDPIFFHPDGLPLWDAKMLSVLLCGDRQVSDDGAVADVNRDDARGPSLRLAAIAALVFSLLFVVHHVLTRVLFAVDDDPHGNVRNWAT
jgi:hypothetical protein